MRTIRLTKDYTFSQDGINTVSGAEGSAYNLPEGLAASMIAAEVAEDCKSVAEEASKAAAEAKAARDAAKQERRDEVKEQRRQAKAEADAKVEDEAEEADPADELAKQLNGVGRERAQALVDAGCTTVADVVAMAREEPQTLEAINGISAKMVERWASAVTIQEDAAE